MNAQHADVLIKKTACQTKIVTRKQDCTSVDSLYQDGKCK